MHNFSKNYRSRLIGMSRVGVIREQQKKKKISVDTNSKMIIILLFLFNKKKLSLIKRVTNSRSLTDPFEEGKTSKRKSVTDY